jgi:hypothetical protein
MSAAARAPSLKERQRHEREQLILQATEDRHSVRQSRVFDSEARKLQPHRFLLTGGWHSCRLDRDCKACCLK